VKLVTTLQQFLRFDKPVHRKDIKRLPKDVKMLSEVNQLLVKKQQYVTQHCDIDTLNVPLQIKNRSL